MSETSIQQNASTTSSSSSATKTMSSSSSSTSTSTTSTTVTKKRIVSDDDLEESLMQEFNMRLKTCLSNEVLNDEDDDYGLLRANENHDGNPGGDTNSNHSNHTDVIVTTDEPSNELPPDGCSVGSGGGVAKSAKDRMLLSTDSASCLLFTQTVTSPMLTPSEEKVDFLKGFSSAATAVDAAAPPPPPSSSSSYSTEEIFDDDVSRVVTNGNATTLLPEDSTDTSYSSTEQQQKTIESAINNNNNNNSVKQSSVVAMEAVAQQQQQQQTVVNNNLSDDNPQQQNSSVKKKKSKKSKNHHHHEKENISVKSSFSKFDALQKKNVLHVRSTDGAKAQEKFNGNNKEDGQNSNCKACNKIVFQMEQIKAERSIWHKNCFRCQECNKQLTVDTYESHEGTLYCKPHFKALFAPKVVEEEQNEPKIRKHELIIRENQPKELPPDVVRASDKPDLGLEELQSLNVKERFHVFEDHQQQQSSIELNSNVVVKRSPSILSKLARFQAKGMDVGVADESLNGIPIEESSSSSEEGGAGNSDDEEGGANDGSEDADLVRARRVQKEKPFHFTGMSDVKKCWEQQGESSARDERREERKQEIQNIRNRLFMGKQGKMKELYQQAVMESETGANVRKSSEVIESASDTRTIKERFEKGGNLEDQLSNGGQNGNKVGGACEEDAEVFESAISKNSRSIFLELDANASKPPQLSPQRSSSKMESPEKEVYHDPDVVRGGELVSEDDSQVAKQTQTAKKMLNKFRQMEEEKNREPVPMGPKPLKRFTPPPEPVRSESEESGVDEDGSESIDDEEDDIDCQQQRIPDADLLEAQKAARAQKLRAKFEKWEANEIKREQSNAAIYDFEDEQIESTKSLRARFESLKEKRADDQNAKTQRVKVNRFVDSLVVVSDSCQGCQKRVYPLEKIAVHGVVYHKGCFKCMECQRILRMDTYTYNQGLLYCTPHFKRLFITKGNYDTAFGFEQHKEKWNASLA